MYLSKLDISGFKSFAGRTRFEFNDGIAAIVGPNGCGKTNVVDAVRWVLGEQKTAVLRSDIMENVIFNGSKDRKQLGMAEVSLTLQNNKKILPTEYDEVTITRRLFRNGTSEYLLNKAKCRLRDITDLFMDTGMGSDSYSVIELKMVEAILSGKVDERRHLFEEAAGVNKYKTRRKEAERKLENVQYDLVRVEDLVEEVRKAVNSLKRQASKTRRYNKIRAELSEVELSLMRHEYNGLKEKAEAYEIQLNEDKDKKTQLETELNDSEKHLEKLNNDRSELENEYQDAVKTESQIKEELSNKSKELAVKQEKRENLLAAEDRIEKDTENLRSNKKELTENIENSEKELISLRNYKDNAGDKVQEKKEKRDEVLKIVSDLRNSVNSSNEKILKIKNRLESIESEYDRNLNQKAALQDKIENADKELDEIRNSQNELENEYNESLKQREELESSIKKSEEELKEAQRQKADLQEEMENIRTQTTNKKNDLAQVDATLEFLEGLVDSDESSQFLLNNKKWQPKGEKALLGESIGADDKFLVAIDTALGDAVRYFVVEDRDEAVNAFDLLSDNKKGKATFVVKNEIPEIAAPVNISVSDGVYGWASELVRVNETLRYALRGILGKTAITENLDKAINLVDNGTADSAVTLDGKLVKSRGVLRGGSVIQPENITVGKKERIDRLTQQRNNIENEISKLNDKLAELKSKNESINIDDYNKALRKAEQEKNENENKISQLNYRRELLGNNLFHIEENKYSNHEQIEYIDKELENSETEKNELLEELQEIQSQFNEKNKQLKESEAKLNEYEQQLRKSEISDTEIRTKITSCENEIDRLKARIESTDKNIQSLKNEYETNKAVIEKLKNTASELENQIQDLQKKDTEANNRLNYVDQKLSALKEQINQASEDISRQRKVVEKEREAIYQKELHLNEYHQQMRSIAARALDGYEIELKNETFEKEENFNIDEQRAKLRDLSEKLKNIGPVNHRALDDYEKESERLDFYENQLQDLTESKKNLSETIREINNTAERKFIETFDQIHENFKTLFKTLFGETGDAELKIDTENPLDTDISIIAKPPGKKPHSIEGISSGEKTLTAIALLFAIYLVKPSPFCILDEVDAPLDDANIDRFIKLIKDFRNGTQFIIVTHNKRTMEAADNLYGITMQEDGVSKVVSVKMNQVA